MLVPQIAAKQLRMRSSASKSDVTPVPETAKFECKEKYNIVLSILSNMNAAKFLNLLFQPE